MKTLCLDLNGLIIENRDRCICYGPIFIWEESEICEAYIDIPYWVENKHTDLIELSVLYLAARVLNDHSVWKAYHLKSIMSRKQLSRDFIEKLLKDATTEPNPSPIDWISYWRGLAEAYETYLSKIPVVIVVKPEKRNEDMKITLEGSRNPRHRKRTWGIIGRVKGRKIGPWVYVIPRDKMHIIISEIGDSIEIITPETIEQEQQSDIQR